MCGKVVATAKPGAMFRKRNTFARVKKAGGNMTLHQAPTQDWPHTPSDEYRYFDHDADLGVAASAASMETALERMAYAVFSVMTDLSRVLPLQRHTFQFEEADLEFALVTWLNLLLSEAQIQHMVFAEFHLRRDGAHWIGEAAGEAWHQGLPRGVEVKGATLTMLSVRQENGLWQAQCVVDV
jgi:SHS2 domain-containing protein